MQIQARAANHVLHRLIDSTPFFSYHGLWLSSAETKNPDTRCNKDN
jgi:hypothetical protein